MVPIMNFAFYQSFVRQISAVFFFEPYSRKNTCIICVKKSCILVLLAGSLQVVGIKTAEAQADFVTVGTGTAEYATFYGAYASSEGGTGKTYIVHGETVDLGAVVVSSSDVSLSILPDSTTGTGANATIDAQGGSRFFLLEANALNVSLTRITLSGAQTNGASSIQDGGAIYAHSATITGSGTFQNNKASQGGGAVWGFEGISLDGEFVFSGNQAQQAGGALYGFDSVTIAGNNRFSDNTAAESAGGAVWSYEALTVSGVNVFENNTSYLDGGAIYGFESINISGENTFSNNTVVSNVTSTGVVSSGGAIYAVSSLTFSGSGSIANFTGNKVAGAQNDVYLGGQLSQFTVTIQDSGVYHFGGGITTSSRGNLVVKNGANVVMGEGSISKIDSTVTLDNALLTVQGGTSTTFSIGTAAGSFVDSTANGPNFLNFEHSVDQAGLVLTGNATGLSGQTQTKPTVTLTGTNADQYVGYVSAINDAGITTATAPISSVGPFLRFAPAASGGGLTFEQAGETVVGTGTVTSGNVLIATGNGDSGGSLTFSDSTVLTFQSNTDTIRVISGGGSAADLTTGAPFLAVTTGNLTLTVQNIQFSNGYSDSDGGAISAASEINLIGAVEFANNATAGKGGAAAAQTITINGQAAFTDNQSTGSGGALSAQSATINGNSTFSGNKSSDSGGAIAANTIVISGRQTFTGNSAQNVGGALAGNSITFSGVSSTIIFSGNRQGVSATAAGTPNDIYLTNDSTTGALGALTIQDTGTYSFGGGIDASGGGSVTVANGANAALIDSSVSLFTGTLTTDSDSQLTIQDSANAAINGTATLAGTLTTEGAGRLVVNSSNVSFPAGSTANLGGLTLIGSGIKQTFHGGVVLSGEAGVTWNGNGFSQIDFQSASSVSVSDTATAVVYDTAGNQLTAEYFKGMTNLNNSALILGSNDELQNLPSDEYSSVLYNVRLGFDSESGNYVLQSIRNSVNSSDWGGNVPAADHLFGDSIFDVPTDEEVYQNTARLTREGVASAGSAMVNRISFLNRQLTHREAGLGFCCPNDPCTTEEACAPNRSFCRNSGTDKYLWVAGYGLGSSVQRYKGFGDYDFNSGAALFGIDWYGGKKSATGAIADYEAAASLYFGYGQSTVKSFGSALKSKDYSFGGTLRWNDDWKYVSVLGGFHFNDFEDGSRQLTTENSGESAGVPDFNAWESTVYAELGARPTSNYCPALFGGDKTKGCVNPYAALQYISYFGDASCIDDNFEISATKLNSLQTILGLRGTYVLNRSGLLNRSILKDSFLMDSAAVSMGFAWRHEFFGRASFTATVGDNSAIIYGNAGGRDFAEYTAGLEIEISRRVTLSGDYYLYFNRYTAVNAGMGTAAIRY